MDNWKEQVADCADAELASALTGAIEELFARDRHLLDVDAHENAIAGLLRGYLQAKVGIAPIDGAPWDVDFDYNRHLATVKTINGIQKVRPDLIVHRRNSNINHLAIELKKGSSAEPDVGDLANLEAYRRPLTSMGLGYAYALFLRFGVGADAGKVSSVVWV